MILIRFPNDEAQQRALGALAGRFSFKSWTSGEMTVAEPALVFLAGESIPFSVEGKATYERLISSVRDAVAA